MLAGLNTTNQPLDAKRYLEGVEGYPVPKLASGQCPAGTAPIYRAFKGVPRYVDDGNHRFSTSLTQYQHRVTRLGWTDEGVVLCGTVARDALIKWLRNLEKRITSLCGARNPRVTYA